MMENKRKARILFAVTLGIALLIMLLGVVNTDLYNREVHEETFAGAGLFEPPEKNSPVSVTAAPRSSTWGKVFDFNDEGLTEENYRAYTYDFSITNNTWDQVKTFTFTLTFSQEAYLAQAWNGALEIHQVQAGYTDTIPDLRDYRPENYKLEIVTVDGDNLVKMNPGDYFIYYPSSTQNAMEVPIESLEGTTPGVILYTEMGESIEDSSLTLTYTFHRVLTQEPLCWVSLVLLVIWLFGLVVYVITSAQIRKYMERHERDNEIINESIETFIGFIDAKDPYTHGHSKRVAIYTRLLAQELGYTGEELDKIYYTALLHDCGKIGVPDNILRKPGRLTDEEFEIIKSHTVRGGEILASFKSLPNVGEGARYHHERYDGRGYPEGLAGEDIPFIARMICVADSFDAMNTNRVYRKKLSKERIIEEIVSNKGKQFDPQIADIMLTLLRDEVIKIDENE